MQSIKIGLIKEGKTPIDHRVPLTPEQAKETAEKFRNTTVVCQQSNVRCYTDEEYLQQNIPATNKVDDCDVLMGVKEVPIDELIPGKTYFFFSHTTKAQPYNRNLLRAILDKKIRLIDYEMLTDAEGIRIVAFGRYAGIVGAYNTLWTYGKRYNAYNLKRAHECFDLEDLKTQYHKVKLPAIKIAMTGGGRVAKGAMEVLNGMGIRKVSPAEFLTENYDCPVYTQLNSRDYHVNKSGSTFSRTEFYQSPENYTGDFLKYAKVADILLACAYWKSGAPVLFTQEDILRLDFKLRIIGDVTCDIDGSIPATKRPTTIAEPVYDYNPTDDKVEAPFTNEGNITVMAVDNLPCELPRNASHDFGRELVNNVLPCLLSDDGDEVIKRATITENGKLMERYAYLQDFVDGTA